MRKAMAAAKHGKIEEHEKAMASSVVAYQIIGGNHRNNINILATWLGVALTIIICARKAWRHESICVTNAIMRKWRRNQSWHQQQQQYRHGKRRSANQAATAASKKQHGIKAAYQTGINVQQRWRSSAQRQCQ